MIAAMAVADADLAGRLSVASEAVEAAGAALLVARAHRTSAREAAGGQLKTAVDQAAEGWVLGYLRANFPQDRFLCEEEFERAGVHWEAPAAYWTVDALDGTRSLVEGFEGFCVQVAYVREGRVLLGVVREPVRAATYWAVARGGAFLRTADGRERRLRLPIDERRLDRPIFVDSTLPTGAVGQLRARLAGGFLECGSIGLKLCRVADGSADVFAKEFTFKLWDVAPGALIVDEAGGAVGLWSGVPIPLGTEDVYFENLLAARRVTFARLVAELGVAGPPGAPATP